MMAEEGGRMHEDSLVRIPSWASLLTKQDVKEFPKAGWAGLGLSRLEHSPSTIRAGQDAHSWHHRPHVEEVCVSRTRGDDV